ncbi:unnamed protein product [Cylicocyclus nassatus]|uniref:Apple domain-containing protein n=1 Tax=Cylicocyclus nassatus TaxID=53992 RepID=A0AA36M2P7_CYLNA|nr:unnamed protein product [Cylicocyclus nassatus]
MYSFYLKDNEDKAHCLRACYEEKECKAVHYNEEERSCQLVRIGKGDGIVFEELYVLSREETDSSCMTETSIREIPFQSIPKKGNTFEKRFDKMPDVAVIQPYDHLGNYHFFLHSHDKKPIDYNATGPTLFFSRKAEETCTSVPVFRKANRRRLYFGEIYNTTGYFFYDAYAFADHCVSPLGECLGIDAIQEYKDEEGSFFYDKPGIENMADSGLGQAFFIARLS